MDKAIKLKIDISEEDGLYFYEIEVEYDKYNAGVITIPSSEKYTVER